MPGRTPYPLAALEGMRRRHLEAARMELASAIADATAAGARAAAATAAQAEATRIRRAAEGKGTCRSPLELDAHGKWLARLRRTERRLEEEAGRSREEAALAVEREERHRDRIVAAERRLRTVERHREGWERARLRAAQGAEEAEQEDRALSARAQRPT
jgi:hypothetical protein